MNAPPEVSAAYIASTDKQRALALALAQVMKRFADIDLSADDCGRARAARWLADRYTEVNLLPGLHSMSSTSYAPEG